MALSDLVLCRCKHPRHSHLHGEGCGDCDCAYFFDREAWKLWCADVYEGRTQEPVFNRWCNPWSYAEKRFEGDCGPSEFKDFARRVAPPYRKPAHTIIRSDDGWAMIVNVREGSGTITSTLFDNEELDDAENNMIDAIESLVLAHACAGIDVSSAQYVEGLETTINRIFQ